MKVLSAVVCLFGMILAYQVLLPRKRKPSSQLRALAPPPAKPLLFTHRFRLHFNTLLIRLKLRAPSAENSRRHRTLRPLHLCTPERKGRREEMRSRFAGPLRLNLNLHKSPKPHAEPFYPSDPFCSYSPHDYKHSYIRLEEPEELAQPSSAVISPWSPFDDIWSPEYASYQDSPILHRREPSTPLSLSPLPSAHLYDTPTRYGHQTEGTYRVSSSRDSLAALASPTLVGEEADAVDNKTLIEEIDRVLEYTRDWAQEDEQMGSFVIGEDDDLDYETISISDGV
ncbi:hypothetical protein EIP86_010657 [Pleurotus ostreatoroseus]|nr:hypothetical protein EIP86_010657 [Pleurotus ostreatoroseus]